MRGVTKPITLEVELLGIAPGMRGGIVLGLEAEGKVNRKDFGIIWNKALDTGGFVLGEDIVMTFQIEAKQPPKEAATEG